MMIERLKIIWNILIRKHYFVCMFDDYSKGHIHGARCWDRNTINEMGVFFLDCASKMANQLKQELEEKIKANN